MEKIANSQLSVCREESFQIIQQNFEVFRSLVEQAKDYLQHGQYDAAAINVELAAYHTTYQHCGFFLSAELEEILVRIGRKAINSSVSSRNSISSSPQTPKKILHVSTNISIYSGIPRLIRRWIQQDRERLHSLALTKQAPDEIPKILREAVLNSNGNIYVLNESIGGLVSRAKQLQEIAATVDVVVLHTWECDAVPTIAFANKEQSPPVIYVNHGDHCLWLGTAISDVVANLRESGMRLSLKRRGIEPERNMILPTILEPAQRLLSRKEAKREIGIDENSVLLISIARSAKYKMIDDGTSFVDAHVPLLKKYKQANLVVIGPGDSEDWSAAIEQTQGRIKALGQTENTALFYQAADIYVDSFPFVSNTSLLEAGSYGVPLVSRYPYSSESCEILGADMPGLTGNLIRVQDLDEYTKVLSRLVEDEEFRFCLGEATRRKITEMHWGSKWQSLLEDVYVRAATLPRVSKNLTSMDEMFLGEPDVFLPHVHDNKFNFDWIILLNMRTMPFAQRWHYWNKLGKKNGNDFYINFSFLFPQWLYISYFRLKITLKKYFNRAS